MSASNEICGKVTRVLVESLNVRNSTVRSPFNDSLAPGNRPSPRS
jgi:hypothetical protein